MHKFPSLQSLGGPGTHLPSAHVSFAVQALLSVQPALLNKKVQPDVATHKSSVQGLPSLQLRTFPAVHAPPAHTSAVVQAFPSEHGRSFALCVQPLVGAHASVVQAFWSSHEVLAPGKQTPPPQWSPVVHALVSSHGEALARKTQPVVGAHESFVHGLPSLHAMKGPLAHAPAAHVSPCVQTSPSLHDALLFVALQPPTASHDSVVHGLPSSQVLGFCGLHTPPEQASPSVQLLLSEQGAVLATNVQPLPGAQLSSVHGLPSEHARVPPAAQLPP